LGPRAVLELEDSPRGPHPWRVVLKSNGTDDGTSTNIRSRISA